MCEATTIVGVTAAAIGTAVSVYGQVKSGQAQSEVAKNNAQALQWERSAALQQGQAQADAVMREARSITSSAEAALGANSIESSTGSSANMMASSMMEARRDVEIARANALRRAMMLENQRNDTLAQSAINRRASYLGAVGTGLQGVASIANIYANRPKG